MEVLVGKTAIVTGASRGIGAAIARALHREGVRLALLSRTAPEAPGHFVPCDLADATAIPPAVEQALSLLGGSCDFLINNAGQFLEQPVTATTLADWERVLRVNVTAPFLVTKSVLPGMIARRSGRIVNIASTASLQGYLHQAAYVASKHALLGFARALAMECKPHGIHVHTLCPGGVDTTLTQGTALAARLAGQPMILPADVAEFVVFLLQRPRNLDLPELVIRRFAP